MLEDKGKCLWKSWALSPCMINDKIKKIFIYIVLVLFVFALDRISKSIILNILDDTGKVDIYVNSFFSLFLVWNKGIGFGLFSFDKSSIYNGISLIILIINFIIIYLIYFLSFNFFIIQKFSKNKTNYT